VQFSKKSPAQTINASRENPEDAYIAYLEGQLGQSNNRGKKKAREFDGLDGIPRIYCPSLLIANEFTAWQTS
jgi:hypothetical protein